MLNVTYQDIHHIKRLNLPQILQERGIPLKQNNGSYLALCPFHNDKNPSLSVSFKNGLWLWHCFGCHKGGGVLDFLTLYGKKPFKDIYLEYKKDPFFINNNNKEEYKEYPLPDKDIQNILNQTITLYHNNLKEDTMAQAYLKTRGLLSKDLIDTFKIGYCNGSVKTLLPNDEAARESLKALGLLNDKENESFYKSITVPIFDEAFNVVGLYGRNTQRKAHLYLKGKHRGIFNHKALKVYDEVILTESIIDALSLYREGIKNVTASYGTNGFTEDHLKAFKENNIKCVYIAYDNDETGHRQALEVAKHLTHEGFDVRRIHLPDDIKDINDYFRYNKKLDFKGTKDTFERLIKDSKKIGCLLPKKEDEGLVSYEEGSALFRYKNIDYKIKGIDLKIKDELRAIIEIRSGLRRHQDRFCLYSAKSRSLFINQASRKLSLSKEKIEEDILTIIETIENIKKDELDKIKNTEAAYQMAPDEEKEALKFLKDPRLIKRICDDITASGYVGEDTNKLIAYLVATSRKLKKPLSCIIISQSSSGKSYLMEVIASLMPEEDVEFYSRITPQSLYYMEEYSLRHKLLIIDERSGSEEADYAIRSLQSRHKLSQAYPIKDPNSGRMKTIVIIMYGPVSVMESTTKSDINPENTSRSLQLYLDESEAQTKRVQGYQRFIRSLDGWRLLDKRPKIIKLHNNAQRLLRPIKIIIPYINKITFPSRWMRTRRDQDRFLCLIEAVTFLYQYQRDLKEDQRGKPYIEAALNDYEIAYNLAKESLLDSQRDLKGQDKAFYEKLEKKIKKRADRPPEEFEFKKRDVREWLDLPEHYVKRKLATLEELEYISCARTYAGGSSIYKIMPRVDKDTIVSNLIHPRELQKSWTNQDKSGTTRF